MSERELSVAEEQGWRRYWDGWVICPSCKSDPWPVPAHYDSPIKEGDRCLRCGRYVKLTPTPSTAEPSVEQRAREMTREFMRRVHALPSQSDIEGFAKDCLTRALQSTDEVAALMAENERLREATSDLIGIIEGNWMEVTRAEHRQVKRAREALSLISGEGVRS